MSFIALIIKCPHTSKCSLNVRVVWAGVGLQYLLSYTKIKLLLETDISQTVLCLPHMDMIKSIERPCNKCIIVWHFTGFPSCIHWFSSYLYWFEIILTQLMPWSLILMFQVWTSTFEYRALSTRVQGNTVLVLIRSKNFLQKLSYMKHTTRNLMDQCV